MTEGEQPTLTLYIQPSFQMPRRERCFSGTPFAHKVQRILQFKGLAFEVKEVGWLERNTFLGDKTSAGKLPLLDYDGTLIEDSTAMAYFIEERHPDPALIPADPVLRARCHFLEEWADEVLYWYGRYEVFTFGDSKAQVDAYFHEFPEDVRAQILETVGTEQAESLKRHGVGHYPPEKVQADILRGLDGLAALVDADGFAAGPALSLADCALFGQLHRRLAGTNPWLEEQVRARPALPAWLARVDELTTPNE